MNEPLPVLIAALAGAYLCGAIPSGLWLARAAGVDVRASGSGNIGATNVARSAGMRLGIATLVLDASKGALPVVLARVLAGDPRIAAAVGLAAFYGHIFSIFAGFRGGKGVATAAGVFLALSPLAFLAALTVFALAAAFSRIVSVASLAAGFTLPLACLLLAPTATTLAAVVVALSLLFTHRDNLRRLANGTEPRFRAARPS